MGRWWETPGKYRKRSPRLVESTLELGIAGRAGERDDVADVLHAGEVHHHPFQAEAEAGVGSSAELAQFQVPPVRLLRQALLPDGAEEDVVALLALAAA